VTPRCMLDLGVRLPGVAYIWGVRLPGVAYTGESPKKSTFPTILSLYEKSYFYP